MARRIAGITIEIGGDTTQLNKALKGVDSQLNQTQRNLRDVGKLLKLDPKNTELLTQKQKYLTDAIDNTKKRLADLKTASEQAAKSAKNYDAWKAKFDPIQEALKETRQKSEDLKKQLEKLEQGGKIDTDEYRKLQGELKETDEQAKRLKEEGERVSEEYGKPISPEKFDALQREIAETEQDLKGLQKEFKDFGSVAKQKLTEVGKSLKKFGDKVTGMGTKLSQTVTAPLVGVGAVSVKKYADVDKTMTLANKTMGNTEEQAKSASDAMKKAASNSTYGMSDAANAYLNFARAGLTAEQANAALAPAMNLAAGEAGDLDTVSAGLVGTINGFHGSFEDAGKYADVFANACNNSALDINGLSNSMGVAAPVFNALGYTVQDAALYLGTMAENQIDASVGANSLKTGLARLISPAKEGATWMDRLGIKVTNTDGSMKDSLTVQKELHDAFMNLSKSEQTAAAAAIFGKNQMAPWLALINTAPEDVSKFNTELGATGTTSEMADAMMSGFGGSIEKLKSSIDVAAYSFGHALAPTISQVADKIQQLVDWFNGLDESQQQTIAKIALVVAAVGPVLVAVGSVASGIGSIIELGGILLPVIGSVGSVLFGSIIPAVGGLLAAAAPLIPIIAAIVAVVWMVVAAIKHWGEITAAVKEAFVKNGGGLKGAVAAVLAGIAGIWKASFDELDKLTGGKLGQIVKVIDQHLGWAKALFKGWKDGVVLVGGSALEAVQENLNRIAKAFKDNGGGIKGTVAALATALKGQFTVVLSFIDKLTGGKLTDIKNKFRMAFTDVARTVVGKFIYIKDGIKEKLDAAYNTVHNIVERIKSIFNFRISLPKPDIPTPHVNWIDYGTFSLPSIEWYRKAYDNAMLFRSPTVLATGAGLKGFGDGPGGEIVMGLSKLRELVGSGGETNYTATFNIYTQPGQDNRQIARMVQDQFVRWQRQKETAKV